MSAVRVRTHGGLDHAACGIAQATSADVAEVMSVLEDVHDTTCRVLLLPRIPRRARDELRAMLTDRVRPVLDREGRRRRAMRPSVSADPT